MDLEANQRILVIQSGLTDKNHMVGTAVLTFQTGFLGYHPSNGQLYGPIEVILSDGDFWKLLKGAKISLLKAMAASMVSREMLSGMEASSRRKLESVEHISREVVETLWTMADSPGVWFYRKSDGEPQQLVVKDYIYFLLEAIYNPEYKEWIYKSDENIQDKELQNNQ
jgi:hypothetical protein